MKQICLSLRVCVCVCVHMRMKMNVHNLVRLLHTSWLYFLDSLSLSLSLSVHVSMCVYVCVCMCVCFSTKNMRIWMRMYICTCVRMYEWCLFSFVDFRILCVCVHVCVCVHACAYVGCREKGYRESVSRMCVCMMLCMFSNALCHVLLLLSLHSLSFLVPSPPSSCLCVRV